MPRTAIEDANNVNLTTDALEQWNCLHAEVWEGPEPTGAPHASETRGPAKRWVGDLVPAIGVSVPERE